MYGMESGTDGRKLDPFSLLCVKRRLNTEKSYVVFQNRVLCSSCEYIYGETILKLLESICLSEKSWVDKVIGAFNL